MVFLNIVRKVKYQKVLDIICLEFTHSLDRVDSLAKIDPKNFLAAGNKDPGRSCFKKIF